MYIYKDSQDTQTKHYCHLYTYVWARRLTYYMIVDTDAVGNMKEA